MLKTLNHKIQIYCTPLVERQTPRQWPDCRLTNDILNLELIIIELGFLYLFCNIWFSEEDGTSWSIKREK